MPLTLLTIPKVLKSVLLKAVYVSCFDPSRQWIVMILTLFHVPLLLREYSLKLDEKYRTIDKLQEWCPFKAKTEKSRLPMHTCLFAHQSP